MKSTFKKGLGYGLTSGVITTLGLIVGLQASTQSMKAVVGGVLIIAIADALSDALGIHISEEAEGDHTHKEVWEATIATFLAKFCFALTFLVPLLLLPINQAIWASVAWGLFLIGFFTYSVAHAEKSNPTHALFEHVGIALLVIILTYSVGNWIGGIF